MKNKYFLATLLLFASIYLTGQEPITNAKIEDFEGNEFILSDVLEDKRYIVNVYADWCGWCFKEWISWSECIDDIKTEFNIEFLVLATNKNVPLDDSKEKLRTSLGQFVDLVKLSIYYINQDLLTAEYGVNAFPTSFILDEDGSILDTLLGYHVCEPLENVLIDLFGLNSVHNQSKGGLAPVLHFQDGTISIQQQTDEVYMVDIHSIGGQLLKSYRLQGSAILDINDISDKFVIVSMIMNNRIVTSQKFVLWD